MSSSDGDISEGDQPVCDGTNIKRRAFEASFLALSNEHNFSKSTRTDILKFLDRIISKPNFNQVTILKKFYGGDEQNFSKYDLRLCCHHK